MAGGRGRGARARGPSVQLEMATVVEAPRRRGGKRKGAGRKPAGRKAGVAHARRPRLEGRRHPVHVTCRVERGVRHLRGFKTYPIVRRALCAAACRFDVRIVQFSVQGNHIHLIVEAADERALGRAMKGFEVRVARGLNRAAGRRGRVFADRYHARYLRTPTEVRNALVYVLGNGAKHGALEGREAEDGFDPLSSAAYFTGWAARCRRWLPARDAPGHPLHEDPAQRGRPVRAPLTWMLREGWLRAGGPLSRWERPRG